MTSETRLSVALDDLDRRIIEALQIDGRASWLRISRVLGENERTVARRGSRLLDSGVVRVAGMQLKSSGTVLSLRCGSGQIRMCSRAVSSWPETMWSHMVAGSQDIVAEVNYPKNREQSFLLDEVPSIPGLAGSEAYPVLRYLRTAHQWRPGILSSDECEELEAATVQGQGLTTDVSGNLSKSDLIIHTTLTNNGRATYEEVARLAGISEATVSRRVEYMQQNGLLVVRAVVDPSVLGLAVKALIWIQAKPEKMHELSLAIESNSRIRYASRITGPYQVLIAVDLATKQDLDSFLSEAEWVKWAEAVNVSTVVATGKRGGLLSDALQ